MNPKSDHLQTTLNVPYQAETLKSRLGRNTLAMINPNSHPLQSNLSIPHGAELENK